MAAFFSIATMLTLARVFWQQPCEAGICICPHSLFMMWQQARSAALICASGAMQATMGDRQMMFNSNSAPRLDRNFTLQDTPCRSGLLRVLRARRERECHGRCGINHGQMSSLCVCRGQLKCDRGMKCRTQFRISVVDRVWTRAYICRDLKSVILKCCLREAVLFAGRDECISQKRTGLPCSSC